MDNKQYYNIKSVEDILYNYEGGSLVEEWRDIDGYEGHYTVSNLGRVKSLKRIVNHSFSGYITMPERILSQKSRKRGDLEVNLAKDGVHTSKLVHRLVAQAFISNHKNLPEVNHKKGVVKDNRVTELEWMTASENQLHSYRVLNRCRPDLNGNKNPNYGNYKLYVDKGTGSFFTLKDISELYGTSVKNLSHLFWRNQKDKRIINFIKA